MKSTVSGFYVYTLAYPDGRVFYVGYGSKNRIDQHEQEARRGGKSEKCEIIRSIEASGRSVIKAKVYEGIISEQEAEYLEKEVFHRYNVDQLSNKRLLGSIHPSTEFIPKSIVIPLEVRIKIAPLIEQAMKRDDIEISKQSCKVYLEEIACQAILKHLGVGIP